MGKIISIKEEKKTKLYNDFQSYLEIQTKSVDEIIDMFVKNTELTAYLPLSEKEIKKHMCNWIAEYRAKVRKRQNKVNAASLIEKAINESGGELRLAEAMLFKKIQPIMFDKTEKQVKALAKKLINDYFTQNQIK